MADEYIFDTDKLITFCSFVEGIPAEEFTESLLEINLQELNENWAQVQTSYKAMYPSKEKSIDTAFRESANGKYKACMQAYQKCKSKILDAQRAFVEAPPQNNSTVEFNDNSFACVKVPPCDTGVFFGGYEEWPTFRDMFTAVYIDNPRIPPVQKLYHLKLKVQGQASSVIRRFKLSANNFSIAWEALRDKFENERILIENQVKVILNLPRITAETSEALQNIQSTISDCLEVIKSLDIPIGEWDPFVVILCTTKLPVETLELWEQSLESHKKLVKWERMDKFLSHRCSVVECLESRKMLDSEVNSFNTIGVPQFTCKLCNATHSLKFCAQFKRLDPHGRYNFVSKNKICINCLSYSHLKKACPSKYTCTHCKKTHHSLLHFSQSMVESEQIPQNTEKLDVTPSTSSQARTNSHFTSGLTKSTVENTFLPTAVVQIENRGEIFNARALLDQCSEKSFITKRLMQRLMLPTEPKRHQVHGMGGEKVGNSNFMCDLTLVSKKHEKHIAMKVLVVPKISDLVPSFSISKSDFSLDELDDLELADPSFYSPGHVDLLLGGNVLPQLFLAGLKEVNDSLMAQATIFGWIISGPMETNTCSSFAIGATEVPHDPIENQLKRFWELEEIPDKLPLSEVDQYCETLYQRTTSRTPDGRYIVKLPFKSGFPHDLTLGCSRPTAYAQYLRQEQSMMHKPQLAETYHKVLTEYLDMDHMEPTTSREAFARGSYFSFYLPHHSVLKPESRSTKVRVVFNASKRTSTGNSLNDVLHVGPALQSDLMTLVIKWRLYRFVFNGDIEKMYRQIQIHSDDFSFQRILFRQDPTGPVQDFTLKTVTFGVNCAPYLAIRTLIQLARDSEDTFPKAAHILQEETYVDDILSGAHDLESALDSLRLRFFKI